MRNTFRQTDAVLFLWIVTTSLLWQARAEAQTDSGRPALRTMTYQPLPLGQIKPAGWLREQLQVQANGLSGHLDEFWPDIKESAWIGGKAEGWERVPTGSTGSSRSPTCSTILRSRPRSSGSMVAPT